jgi:hypothetical protein
MAPFGCQALLLKQVAEPKDRRLVQQPRHGPQRGELAEHGDVVQRLLHRRVARREPLLQVVNRPGAVHPDDRTRDAAHIDYMPPRTPHRPDADVHRECRGSGLGSSTLSRTEKAYTMRSKPAARPEH